MIRATTTTVSSAPLRSSRFAALRRFTRVTRLTRTRQVSLLVVALLAGTSTLASTTPSAQAMRRVRAPYPRVGTAPGMEAAVRSAFPARLHRAALNVAWCESRGKANARNGQYKGHFQMGRHEWAKFGKGGNPYNGHENAAAAYRYYKVAGWGPWECRP